MIWFFARSDPPCRRWALESWWPALGTSWAAPPGPRTSPSRPPGSWPPRPLPCLGGDNTAEISCSFQSSASLGVQLPGEKLQDKNNIICLTAFDNLVLLPFRISPFQASGKKTSIQYTFTCLLNLFVYVSLWQKSQKVSLDNAHIGVIKHNIIIADMYIHQVPQSPICIMKMFSFYHSNLKKSFHS